MVMNYNLQGQDTRTVQSRIEYNIDEAMPYGDFAPSMLMARYEETDIGNDEDVYDNYARDTLTDWRPDTNLMAHEEARGSNVTARTGRLDLIYGGHRGTVDTPYVPERFDQFIGDEDRDPRGINADGAPDMKLFRGQNDERMRFIRWNADGCDNITGGARAERREIADQQAMYGAWKGRLKVFDRQIDGRREGMRRGYEHVSGVDKQVHVQSYGDYIKDHALTPARRSAIICREIVRNGKKWREETIDADWAVARYTQICKSGPRDTSGKSRVGDAVADNQWGVESKPLYFKAAGLLMSSIVKNKAQSVSNARADNTELPDAPVDSVAAGKTASQTRDLCAILRSLDTTTELGVETNTVVGKTPGPQQADHLARQITGDHLTPAHHYLNAEIIYKHVAREGDVRKAKDLVITDARDADPAMIGAEGVPFKSASVAMKSGAKLGAQVSPGTLIEGRETHNYRTASLTNGDKRVSMYAKDATQLDESANSQHRRPCRANYKGYSTNDTIEDMQYGDNAYKDRHARGLGSKYMVIFIDRDARSDDISVAN